VELLKEKNEERIGRKGGSRERVMIIKWLPNREQTNA